MSFKTNETIRDVYGISDEQKNAIMNFLQGAVYCWCKNRSDEWFSIRDLMGGDNYYWEGTPLIALWEKHKDVGAAGKDAGWLLKKVINNDKRTFETKKEELVRKYKWVGDEI
ncbi:hypothetical protein [Bergeyella zoohelcum]|uniref:Uncharacterized protein n=1 Tax=Bergeyella zoohelcum ATCC 43767 TaxID=883096 RepID=K1M0R2_9FLAO|nr:hypothetical protein [Bergeyella zoohelcum]EKB55933.1 hypothetical protein HMPREF9699_01578 [Bergeyella zoohelcum ATCC 43767]SUV50343.1 Uncharacterised protein [Bergeyella zoohelcum]